MNRTTWRYIPPIEASGPFQMALDTWLLEQHRQALSPPILRFYTWSPIAISLGYHQRRYPPFWEGVSWRGRPIDLVRRPSGGRAVLHQGDLTYAVITSRIGGTRMQAYQTICEFLIQAWRSLGVDLHYGEAGRGYIHNPNCFGTATGADLVTSNGIKLIGSAQLRRQGAILQHGSIQLNPDPALFQQVFGETTTPLPVADRPPSQFTPMVINALLTSAQQCFAAEFITQPLSSLEWSSVLNLSTIHSAWT